MRALKEATLPMIAERNQPSAAVRRLFVVAGQLVAVDRASLRLRTRHADLRGAAVLVLAPCPV